MLISRFIINFLFILFAVYYAQGFFYTSGSKISQSLLLLILIISTIYLIKTLLIKNKKSLFYNCWTALLLLNIVGFILTGDVSNVDHISMLKNILGCLMTFYPFYYFSRNNVLSPSNYILFLFIILPITIFQFYYNRSTLVNQLSGINIVNNVGYSFVALFPFIFLFRKRKIITSFLFVLLLFFTIQSAKKGAILCGFTILLTFLYYQMSSIDNKHRLKDLVVSSIIILTITSFTYKTFINYDFLIDRLRMLSEGDVSQRNVLYDQIIYAWYNSNDLIVYLFGFGFARSIDITGGSFAHNDWLELLSNFGLIGISVYILIFYSIVKTLWKRGFVDSKRFLLFSVFAIWFLMSLFSMWYTSLQSYTQAMLLAYLVGNVKNSQPEISKN